MSIGTREYTAKLRFEELKRYLHTPTDIEDIAHRRGTIRLYHGCPESYADLIVKYGPRVPYNVADTAYFLAKLYDVRWIEFRRYAYRAREVVDKVSTSTAPVASRWAWTFPYGEILTDLNAHVRMLVAAKQLRDASGMKLDDAYEEVWTRAIKAAHEKGMRYSTEAAPDALSLPNKIPLPKQSGALVEFIAKSSLIPDHVAHNAQTILEYYHSGEITQQELMASWNYVYIDIKIKPDAIISSHIIIRGMQYWEEDLVEEIIRKEYVSAQEGEYNRNKGG